MTSSSTALAELLELVHARLVDELPELVEVHDRDLRVLAGLLELLDELLDRLELLLDLDRPLDAHGLAAREIPARRELIDLVAIAQSVDHAHELAREALVASIGGVPQAFELGDLPASQRPVDVLLEPVGRIELRGGVAVARPRLVARLGRLVGLEDLARRSSSILINASMLGPSPAIWLGSILTALRRSSSVSRRRSPNMSMCSIAAEAISDPPGSDGGGKRWGS